MFGLSGGQAGGLVGGQLSAHPFFSLVSPCLRACCHDEVQAGLAITPALSVIIRFSARKDIREMMFAEIRPRAIQCAADSLKECVLGFID